MELYNLQKVYFLIFNYYQLYDVDVVYVYVYIYLLFLIYIFVVYDFVKMWIFYFECWFGSGYFEEMSNLYYVVGELEIGLQYLYYLE